MGYTQERNVPGTTISVDTYLRIRDWQAFPDEARLEIHLAVWKSKAVSDAKSESPMEAFLSVRLKDVDAVLDSEDEEVTAAVTDYTDYMRAVAKNDGDKTLENAQKTAIYEAMATLGDFATAVSDE
jgi:hypothetical protein